MFDKIIKYFLESYKPFDYPFNHHKPATISPIIPTKRLKVSKPLTLTCKNGNPVFPYGATLKYLFEISHDGHRKIICIDISHGCIYEVHRLKSKDIINVAATDTSIIFHVSNAKNNYYDGCEFMTLRTTFFTTLMILEGYKDGKFSEIMSRMLPLKEPVLDKLLYDETLDDLIEKRCLNPSTSRAVVNGKGIAATLNSFFIVSPEDDVTVIREYLSCNELIKTYHLPFKVIDIAAGFRHVLLLDDNGKVYSHGVGMHGELGLGEGIKKVENGFLEIFMLREQAPTGIKAIATGALHSVVLTDTGDIYSFGMNEKNVLGPGIDDSSVFDPYPVDLSKHVESVRTSLFTNYIFYSDGSRDVFGESNIPGITELNGFC